MSLVDEKHSCSHGHLECVTKSSKFNDAVKWPEVYVTVGVWRCVRFIYNKEKMEGLGEKLFHPTIWKSAQRCFLGWNERQSLVLFYPAFPKCKIISRYIHKLGEYFGNIFLIKIRGSRATAGSCSHLGINWYLAYRPSEGAMQEKVTFF